MTDYVVGFAFDTRFKTVLLTQALCPPRQVGLLNGIGGKRKDDETMYEAMVREFREATVVDVSLEDWRKFCVLTATDGQSQVFFFATNGEGIEPQQAGDKNGYLQPRPVWRSFTQLPSTVIDSLHWLIPLALAKVSVVAEVREIAVAVSCSSLDRGMSREEYEAGG